MRFGQVAMLDLGETSRLHMENKGLAARGKSAPPESKGYKAKHNMK